MYIVTLYFPLVAWAGTLEEGSLPIAREVQVRELPSLYRPGIGRNFAERVLRS